MFSVYENAFETQHRAMPVGVKVAGTSETNHALRINL